MNENIKADHVSPTAPAFPGQWKEFQPLTGIEVTRQQWPGMPMRAYMATHILAGVLANGRLTEVLGVVSKNASLKPADFNAALALEHADALIAALNK